MPGSAAAKAGLEVGDRILAVNGTPVRSFAQLAPLLRDNPGRRIAIELSRDGRKIEKTARLTTRSVNGHTIGYLGIVSRALGRQHLTLLQIARYAPARAWHMTVETIAGIASAVTTGKGVSHFAGTLEVAHFAGEAAAAGTTQLLALMNLLPIPVLDGGALMFCLIEWLRGRPAPQHVQDFATRTGIAAIASIFALTTLHDLAGFGLFQWLAGV